MLIKFSQDDLKKCQKFAEEIDTGYYSSRGQFNNAKRIKDQAIGKLGEVAVFSYLKEKKIELTEPDFQIYGKNKKSWDYDLKETTNSHRNLHIKSQSSEQGEKYSISWIFQKEDRHIFKDYTENDYVAFTSINLEKENAEIKAIVSVANLHKLYLFKAPKLAYLNSKLAIYYDSLKDLSEDINIVNSIS